MLQLPENQIVGDIRETHAFYVWMGEDGFVRVLYKKDPPVTIDDLNQQFDMITDLNNGGQALVIGDFSRLTRLTADVETRRYAVGPEAQRVFKASAIIGTSGLTRMLGNIFLTVAQSSGYPIRIFPTESKACRWLWELD